MTNKVQKRERIRAVMLALAIVTIELLAVIAWQFPYASDNPLRHEDVLKDFYASVYDEQAASVKDESGDNPYALAAREARAAMHVSERIEAFVRDFHLEQAEVLDVGSGDGYLQDAVLHYTGFDIAPTAARYYHKPFVAGTATAMPFDASSFDAAWSIWVLEHVPNPEMALSEIRRVVKPGGVLFLEPAFDCRPWAAEGYDVRPYSDFGIGGRLIKATIPVRSTVGFWLVSTVPNRLLRSTASWWGPTRFHYKRLVPNYSHYWEPDSDAVNGLDAAEIRLWFESRGDECLNCATGWMRFAAPNDTLVIRVGKSA
jgi:SAM-dependent methyltransferase